MQRRQSSPTSPSATRSGLILISTSCHGWQNRAEAWMPKGAALILEGGFDPNGQFYFLPIHDTARLTQLLRQLPVGLFLKLGLITEQFSETLLCWRHSGFSVDNSVRLDGGDHTARQALAQYSSTSAHALRARSSLRSVHSTGSPVAAEAHLRPLGRQGPVSHFLQSRSRPKVDPISGKTRIYRPPRISSRTSPSSFLPGEYATSTTTGCTPHGARRSGRAYLTSRVSPPRGGGSPKGSRCPLGSTPRSP